jgi:putative Mg2+ transporter-C (MgtC) family protein
VLTLFRRLEMMLPVHFYAHHVVRFARESVMPEERLRAMLREHGFRISSMSYRLAVDGKYFEYRMAIRTVDEKNVSRLAQALNGVEGVREFLISPTGD